jgi:fermentation-respiration switch protein FrsA (DUF1100 family)
MKKTMLMSLLLGAAFLMPFSAAAQDQKNMKYEETQVVKPEKLQLTQEWDKVFPKSDKVDHKKVTFVNRYGITLAADQYTPKNATGKLPALAVSGPFGAVKEQSSGLYAQQMAERGFLTIAFDPSFTGESGGQPRYMASPDINTEDFMAAVDYLSTNDQVDSNRIGIIGICGWGGISLSAAAQDPRIKATVAVTLYDMSRVDAYGYFDQKTPDQRYQDRVNMTKQRTEDYKRGYYKLGGGNPEQITGGMPLFVKQYWEYYKTPRGYHKRSLNSNGGWNVIGQESYYNFRLFDYLPEIRNAVMIVHGDQAHSFYMGKTAYSLLTGNNKELVIVKGANHTDLYDKMDKIPFDKIDAFFHQNLK